jgi:hypothetical protein
MSGLVRSGGGPRRIAVRRAAGRRARAARYSPTARFGASPQSCSSR